MTNELKVEPLSWFVEREIEYKPKHFIVAKTSLTAESRRWIYEKLVGRFAIVTTNLDFYNDIDPTMPVKISDYYGRFPAFEDPREAILYELTWS